MSFTILLLSPDADPSWPEKIGQAVPGAVAKIYADPKDAVADIETADAAYGTVSPELFARAKRLRWICASRAGLGGAYFYDALVKSDVVVTGMHGSYNEHLSTPDRLEERLGEADFVILTTPETPDTLGMFNTRLFSRMKRGAYFINIARGRCVVTQDLIAALQSGHLAGAGLDVVDPEPLPSDSPLWGMPNVLITPHVAILGTPYRQKWEAILLENCRRFAAGQPLLNVVDKEKWF